MALIGMIPEGSTPGKRVRALAEGMGECRKAFMTNTLSGPRLMLYQKLSSLMCWDAALLCAWAAKGIDSPSISLTGKSFGIVEDGSPDKLRSEEHTSELQSRENLVCRLLLEKNNIIQFA